MKIIQRFCLLFVCFIIFGCADSERPENRETVTTVAPSPVVVPAPTPEAEVAPPPKEELVAKEVQAPAKEEVEKKIEIEKEKAKAAAEIKEMAAEKEKKEVARKKRKAKIAKSKKRAKMEFKEIEFDFGVIDQGDKIKHDFVFKNVGNADLEILNVDVTCGCTVPTFPFVPIAPGKKGKISVTYDSAGKLGNQRPMITVVTNARPHTQKIYLKGVVDAERVKEDNPSKTPPENGH